MSMKKVLTLFPILILWTFKLYAQDDYEDSEDNLSVNDMLITVAIGGGIILVGWIISGVKALSGLANLVMGIGAFIAGLAILALVGVILQAAISLALKIAIVVGVIALGIWIISGIIEMFKDKNPN